MEKPRNIGLILLAIAPLPAAIIVLGTIGISAAGLDSHKALSLSGMVAIAVSAVWGVVLAVTKFNGRAKGNLTEEG